MRGEYKMIKSNKVEALHLPNKNTMCIQMQIQVNSKKEEVDLIKG